MSQLYVVVLVWLVLLLLAIPYVRAARHPDSKPLAAYMIFLTVFSVAAYVLFGVLIALIGALKGADFLATPLAAVLVFVLSAVPAFFLARWQIRRAPGKPPKI
jgi:hypothetical protein